MAKFHIDPAGNPGKCRARTRCPWGDLENDHYPSERTARRYYELENATEIHQFSGITGDLIMEIGPRQLPNRSWVTLGRALEDNRWSIHDIELASVTFREEQEKLTRILKTTPRNEWSSLEEDAEKDLALVNDAQVEVLSELTSWKERNLRKIRAEFPEDYAS
jgi:hypothetical protein